MRRSQKRLLGLIAALFVVLILSALLYQAGMGQLEGKERGFWQSLGWAAETLSTTGYGADAVWQHPVMVSFVVLIQFLGVFLVFLIFPIYLIPFLEERFETRLPVDCATEKDHVLIYRHGPAVASLIQELKLAAVTPVVIEEDEAEARRVQDADIRVVYGTLEGNVMQKVALANCRALILNSSDHQNAALTITARQLGYKGDILGLVENPLHRQPTILAGATAAYTPRHVLGAALAARASRKVNPTIAGVQNIGHKLQVREVRITPGSVIAGRTLAECKIGQDTGVTVIGQWVNGRLISAPKPEMRLEPSGILILVGSQEHIEKFSEICTGTTTLKSDGPFIIAGNGEVGRKVAQLLQDAGEVTRLLALENAPGVDLVGNVLDPELLEKAGLQDAQGVILALSEDATTLFATVILKDLAGHVPVIARVNRPENVERIHVAGADFALSISQVTGQILARKLLGKRAVSLDHDLKVSLVTSPKFVGKHPAELNIRNRTGCSVVAVERGDGLLVRFEPDFRFASGDAVYICGSEEATRNFTREFPESTG
ncbi:MAG: NAD-binding protein [Cephaloticoccus sp.]|nr:NAD-binding protein [Cephaloticoccus sp.]